MHIRNEFAKRKTGNTTSHVKLSHGTVTFVKRDRREVKRAASAHWRRVLYTMLLASGLRVRKCRDDDGLIFQIRKQW